MTKYLTRVQCHNFLQMDFTGKYIVDESVVAYERMPAGTLLKKEENHGYGHTRWLAAKHPLLCDEGDVVWVGPLAVVDTSNLVEHLMGFTRVRNDKFLTIHFPQETFGSFVSGDFFISTFGNGQLSVKFESTTGVIIARHTDIILSNLDEDMKINIIWDLRFRKVSSCEGVFPAEFYNEENTTTDTQVVSRRQRRLPMCTGCGERTKGHCGPVGKLCSAAKVPR